MAEICCGIVSDGGGESRVCETKSARRRRMEIRRFKLVAGVSTTPPATAEESVETKRQRMEMNSTESSSFSRECDNADESCVTDEFRDEPRDNFKESCKEINAELDRNSNVKSVESSAPIPSFNIEFCDISPKFGVASVCGRRRDMEDAVAIYPSLVRHSSPDSPDLHYFAVYDGHGCSHVAIKCKERLHELVKEELLAAKEAAEATLPDWQVAMRRSFSKMDKEVVACNQGVIGSCRCELQTPECDAVGSTAVVTIVTPEKIIVANCGDSRAVLCRNGKAVPLSTDHKPDRPDELNRIQEAGGRVIYWDGPRVLGVLAMSRAIGNNYLKPYVSCEPEVTITNRTADDECLILASDGLWDVVSNDTACGVAKMCLRGKVPPATIMPEVEGIVGAGEGMADKACSDASMLLTKLALARHSTDNVSVLVIDLRKDT